MSNPDPRQQENLRLTMNETIPYPGSCLARWRLISICEYLEGVSCFLDPYEVDDNN